MPTVLTLYPRFGHRISLVETWRRQATDQANSSGEDRAPTYRRRCRRVPKCKLWMGLARGMSMLCDVMCTYIHIYIHNLMYIYICIGYII
jgi:hypothetical protein